MKERRTEYWTLNKRPTTKLEKQQLNAEVCCRELPDQSFTIIEVIKRERKKG